jgi:hypothetical protein
MTVANAKLLSPCVPEPQPVAAAEGTVIATFEVEV